MDFSSLSKDEMGLLFLKFADKSLMSHEQLVEGMKEMREEIRKRKAVQIKAALLRILPEDLKPVLLEGLEKISCVYETTLKLFFPECDITLDPGDGYAMRQKDSETSFYMVCRWRGVISHRGKCPQEYEKYKILAEHLYKREDIVEDIRYYLEDDYRIWKEYELYQDEESEKENESDEENE